MVEEGMIVKEEAISRTKGLPASPGAATGTVVFSAAEAEEAASDEKKVILVRIETSPEDIGGMNAAEGILTARGGMTSHAAVVARGMGKCCVAGAGELVINYTKGMVSVGEHTVHAGDAISLNGSTGVVYLGKVPTIGRRDRPLPHRAHVLRRGTDHRRA
jgi:pyruvate,orthophosphate dikinase